MASEYTGADQIRCLHTGAGSHGAAQAAADVSRGNYRASTEVESLGVCLFDPTPGLTIDFASAENGEGNGRLTAYSADSVKWTPPDGTQGAAVTIANGETKVVPGTDTGKYIRVTRTSATDLAGTMTLRLSTLYNNAIGGSNVTSANRAAGYTAYRCVALYNGGGTAISDLEIYGDGIAVGVETLIDSPSVGRASDRTIGAESNGVNSVSFAAGSWVSVGAVAAGSWVAVWIQRTTSPGASASASETNTLRWRHTSGTVTGEAFGNYRLADDSLARYELYRGEDAEPDFDAAAWETFTSLPHETAALTYPHDWYLCTRYRNAYNLISTNITSTIIRLDAAGDEIAANPTDPEEATLTALTNGKARLTARYYSMPDEDEDGAADYWRIYLTSDGSTPDPDNDTPTDVSFWDADGVPALEWDSEAFAAGTTVKVILRMYRSSDEAESENTDVLSCTITTTTLSAPDLGCGWDLVEDATVTTVWEDGVARMDLVSPPGLLRIYANDVLVMGVSADGYVALKGKVERVPFGSDVVMSDYIERYGGGTTRFGALVGATIYRVAEVDNDGNLQVYGVQTHSGWPVTVAGGLGDYYEWNATAGGLDLSADLSRAYCRFYRTTLGILQQATLQARGIRTDVL